MKEKPGKPGFLLLCSFSLSGGTLFFPFGVLVPFANISLIPVQNVKFLQGWKQRNKQNREEKLKGQ